MTAVLCIVKVNSCVCGQTVGGGGGAAGNILDFFIVSKCPFVFCVPMRYDSLAAYLNYA